MAREGREEEKRVESTSAWACFQDTDGIVLELWMLDNVSLEIAKGYKCLVLLGNKVLDADMRWFFGVTDDVAGTFFTD